MNEKIQALFGITSALVTLASFFPYIRSIVSRKTRPERASWWIWSLLMVATLIVQIQQGSTWSLLLTISYLIMNIVVAGLSVKYGFGKFTMKDKLSVVVALVGILLWYCTDSPTDALLVFISIDLIGNVLTYQKTWKSPESENLLFWVLNSSGSILALLSVGTLTHAKVIYPLYVSIVNSMTVVIIMVRRRQSGTMQS